MSSDPHEVKAQRWLNEQIERLKSLRNAKTRDSDFKQWRQATLTVLQRIWPGEVKRHARFRRIPFSPPSSQADAREMREYYERGCAEAAQLLNAFLNEIVAKGLPEPGAPARPAGLDPGTAEDDFPTLDLPGGPAAQTEKPQESVDATPGAVSVRGSQEAADGPARRPSVERRRRHTKSGPRRRLRDMLGLDELEKLAGERESEEAAGRGADVKAVDARQPGADERKPPPPAVDSPSRGPSDDERVGEETEFSGAEGADDAPARTAGGAAARDRGDAAGDDVTQAVTVAEADEVAEDDAEEVTVPAEDDDRVTARADDPDASEDDPFRPHDDLEAEDEDEGEAPFTADEFLSASPIFHTEGKPVRREKREAQPPMDQDEADYAPAPLTSSTAIAVAAIAAEVARLGVPEGHRARTRASLVNLAQLVEDGELDWDGLRGALAFAMEFPPIGRRLVPLLIPFLDRAA